MMLWQFAAFIEGWNRAQDGEDALPAISDEEFDEELRKHGYA